MKTGKDLKLISSLMALLFALQMTSCSSKNKEYEVIKESDPWYECTTFEVSDLYPESEYEYSNFETIGALDGAIYIKADAQKIFEGSFKDLTEEEILQYYETAILKLSFDGELLEKTDYITSYNDGTIRYLNRAWISDGKLNLLESVYKDDIRSQTYIFDGREIDLAKIVDNEFTSIDYLADIYSAGGYTVYSIYVNEWIESLYIERPDGSVYQVTQQIIDALGGYYYDGLGEFIPADNGRVMIPVYINYQGLFYLLLDPATGEVTELNDLGTNEELYMVEFCNDKVISRDYTGFARMDTSTGKMVPFCEYSNIDASMYNVAESEMVYLSDDNSEMILGLNTYESYGGLGGHSGYKFMHLKKADKNPNAGKTVLILSSAEDAFPDEADINAVTVFNRQNDSYFIKFVFPYDANGNFTEVNADIVISDKLNNNPADANKYVDLTPYIDINSDTYFSNAVNAAKNGDSLYHMPLDISASGIITASSNVPQGQTGFTFDSYEKFVDDVCNGVDPMSKTPGFMMGKSEYFTILFMNMSEKFISDGKADIDNEDFRNLMLFVDKNGSDESMSELDAVIASINEHNAAIQEVEDMLNGKTAELDGKLGAVYGNFYTFEDYIDCYSDYGDGLGIYGLPSFDARGPMTKSTEFISISFRTKYIEPCAGYIKLLLSYDIQCTKDYNPINREALRSVAEQKLEAYNQALDRIIESNPAAGRKVPSEAIDKYIDLLSSSYGGINIGDEIEEILREESSSYFNGMKSMDDVIPVMQNRIQTVLNENK